MSASWVTFVFEAANFLVLAALLGRLFFRPVRDALERRRAELEGEREAARRVREEAEAALAEARAQRAELEASLESLRQRGREQVGRERDALVADARAQMQRERERLDQELALRRRSEASSLARDAVSVAREIVERILATIDGPGLEQALLAAACRELAAHRAQAGTGVLEPVGVESARALDRDARAALAASVGLIPEAIEWRDAPELLAGLRVSTTRGLVDASAVGLAAHAERRLAGRVAAEAGTDG